MSFLPQILVVGDRRMLNVSRVAMKMRFANPMALACKQRVGEGVLVVVHIVVCWKGIAHGSA